MWNQFQLHIKIWSRAPNRHGSSSPRRRSHVWVSLNGPYSHDRVEVKSQALSRLGCSIGGVASPSAQALPQNTLNGINKPTAKSVRHVAYEQDHSMTVVEAHHLVTMERWWQRFRCSLPSIPLRLTYRNNSDGKKIAFQMIPDTVPMLNVVEHLLYQCDIITSKQVKDRVFIKWQFCHCLLTFMSFQTCITWKRTQKRRYIQWKTMETKETLNLLDLLCMKKINKLKKGLGMTSGWLNDDRMVICPFNNTNTGILCI